MALDVELALDWCLARGLELWLDLSAVFIFFLFFGVIRTWEPTS
jgi:hypothetical protein